MKLSSLRIQLASFLCLSLLVLWGVVAYEWRRTEQGALATAEDQVRHVSQAFAENTLSTIQRIDLILLELGHTWVERHADFQAEIQRQQGNIGDISIQVGVADRNGDLLFSSLGTPTTRANLADREHVNVHFGATRSRLFISRPIQGRVSGRWALQFTRPLLRNGKFEGVIVISVSPETFSRFYRSASIGEKGVTLMVRDTGEVMARAPEWESFMGRVITGTPYLERSAPPRGNFRRYSQLDGTDRIYGFQRLPEYGLSLVTGVSANDALATFRHQRRVVLSVAGAMSAALVFMAWLIWRSLAAREQTIAVLAETATELENYRGHLQEEVAKRTEELTRTNEELRETNHQLEEAQTMLLQSEKMASLGQLAAGVAHEINNPVGFVSSNLGTMEDYLKDVMSLLDAYQALEAVSAEQAAAIRELKRGMDFDFIQADWQQMLGESRDGLNRVKKIVKDLKEFSHVESQEWGVVDLHEGIQSTLNIVNNEIKYKAKVIKAYGKLPDVECLPGEINQVFMNILVNAAHAIEENGEIRIRTGTADAEVWVEIEDTGCGIAPENLTRIFDPFFTTKPVGKGTGLGLSLAYSIMRKHNGRIEVQSAVGKGTVFRICLPQRQPETRKQAA